ncbi:MAG: hypothetical protein P8N31_01470 [Planctomycetota bacterium]|nr:hypothetical protein [Planctomycetota bacterium]
MNKFYALIALASLLVLGQCAVQKNRPPGPIGPDVQDGPLGTLDWDLGDGFLQALDTEESEEGSDTVFDPAASNDVIALGGGAGGAYGGRVGAVSESPAAGPSASRDHRGLGSGGFGVDAALEGEQLWLESEEKKSQGALKQDNKTWRRAGALANATSLKIGDEDELPLLGIEATAWVDGPRARVLLDCLYKNDREQQLEGTFKLRLPEGATAYYLAFGEEVLINGADWEPGLRDDSLELGPEPESVMDARAGHWRGARSARFVPRGQAARAYKDTVRQNVDPALMEWAGAGVFQTRVFPLVPGATHRIVVGYEVDLVAVPNTAGQYEFSLDMPEDLPGLSLDLHVLAPSDQKVVVTPTLEGSAGYGGRTTYSFGATDERSFRVRMDGLDTTALVAPEDTGYFAMDIQPQVESGASGGSRRAVFLVDTSLSSANGGMETWLDLMEATLANNRGKLTEFGVVFFDVTPRWWRSEFAPNDARTVAELRVFAEGLSLEGASDLGSALAEGASPDWMGVYDGPTWDLFLLSDGAVTWGASNEHAMSAMLTNSAGALFAYTTGQAGTDRRVLEHLTRESGGAVFAVNGPGDIDAASVAHHGMPWSIESLVLGGCSDLLLRGRPTAVYPGQRLRLVGRGEVRAGDAVELVLRQGSRREVLSFPIDETLETTLAARAYGEIATGQLEQFGRATRDAAEAFGTRFRVPGKACSLLMLESEQDYIDQGFLPEDELRIARDQAAAPLVEQALRELAGSLDDPARALLEMLEPLAESSSMRANANPIIFDQDAVQRMRDAAGNNAPGVTLLLDPDFVFGLLQLPKSAFQVETESLAYRMLESGLVPSEVTEALEGGEPAYMLVQEEAQRRLEEAAAGDAVRMISSLVELNPGDGVFARDVAQTLMQWGLYGHAYHLYLRVAEARPFEPQSYLALARCAEEVGKADLALAWYTIALEGQWASRFGDFDRIVGFDALHFLRRLERGELQANMSDWAIAQAPKIVELSGYGEADLAVAIQWNTDVTDIDLHIIEPNGEHCYYGHRDTASGGHLSQDVTRGYGPELFVLPMADSGDFTIFAQYFSGDPNKTAVRTKVLATVYQHWGREDETVTRREILLEQATEQHPIVGIHVR